MENQLSWMIWEKAMPTNGLITTRSNYEPTETMARLKAAVSARGMTVFAHIDHAAGAAEAGLPLRSTDLLIFGSSKGGTPLMQSLQAIGIDLPLKALVWRDEAGATWLSYNDPVWFVERHGGGLDAKAIVRPMIAALDAISTAATSAVQ
jgi:uncharacterized protein (DUF302 family)